ncbi:hypothetical protein [Hymenobacter psychrotolerans]|uniref:Uncharacterized protein n=1 Tax=Hymenobacter psychrotolerans DSM 18569 TaxID=1121959 RepID=A0A1M6WTF4_9BACT|nr:hypothetical protein [Hymenobacter psychrotolerans]SHK97052.1 hypothetical protein SAMN02746009_01895 [Hymenobacter psychrotolerans DSM 18569]
MAASSDSEFLSQKTDAELQFLVQHPDLYHPDLVYTARLELRRRGIRPDLLHEAHTESAPLPQAPDEVSYEEPSWWQRPGAVWVVVLAILLLGGVFYLQSRSASGQQDAAVTDTADDAPLVLQSVETHVIPSFDSLTRAQIAQEMRQLPAAERTRDTAATRRYRLLAERYWKAENQTLYVLERVNKAAADSTLPGQATTVLEEWRRLTKALVYDFSLTPVLAERMNVMRRGAYLRIELLQTMRSRYQGGEPVYDNYLTGLRDSATVMHEALLSRQKWIDGLRRGTSL